MQSPDSFEKQYGAEAIKNRFTTSKKRGFSIKIDVELDLMFVAIIPAININIHSKNIEIEWLVFGIYIGIEKQN